MSNIQTGLHYPLPIDNLPDSWEAGYVGDFSNVIQPGFASGEHNKEGEGIPHLRPMNIDRNGKLDLSVIKYVSPDKDKKRLKAGDVFFNNTNSPELIGKTTVITKDSDWGFSNHMTRIRFPNEISPKFVSYQFNFLWMNGYFLHKCLKHVNQASVSSKTLADSVPIVLAPPNEQKRIVAEIEKQFSRLDEAVVALKSIKANLKRYKASVLKAAVEGKLTEQWRKECPDVEPASELLKRILAERRRKWEESELAKMKAKGKEQKDDKWKKKYKNLKLPDVEGLPNLPTEWEWVTWEAVLAYDNGAFKRGPFGSSLKKSFFVNSGYKVYEQYCPINDDCSFARYFITKEKFKEMEAFSVKARDFLISCSGTLGRITQVPDKYEEGVINQALLRVRINNKAVKDAFFKMFFKSPYFQTQIIENTTGSAIQNVKGVNELKAIPLSLPPLEEQKVIISVIEGHMSVVIEIEKQIDAYIKRAERLRQSILKKAFSGKLVKQDQGDKPTNKLIDAIKLEKEKVI